MATAKFSRIPHSLRKRVIKNKISYIGRLVLWSLCLLAHVQTGKCTTYLKNIIEESGLSTRSVSRGLSELSDNGIIKITYIYKGPMDISIVDLGKFLAQKPYDKYELD